MTLAGGLPHEKHIDAASFGCKRKLRHVHTFFYYWLGFMVVAGAVGIALGKTKLSQKGMEMVFGGYIVGVYC